MRIALFWKYLSLSVMAAGVLVASGCTNCGTPACAPAPDACAVAACDNVSYRPDLYARVACQNPEVSQKTAEALTNALDGTGAAAKPAVLPPVMPGNKAAPQPRVAAGCLVPADTPLAESDVAKYATSEHFDMVETEFVGEPLPPMPTFKTQWPVEPPMDPAS